MEAYVARQPILDLGKKISAYELLFRDHTARYNPQVDGDVATSTVLSNSYFAIGMDSLLGGKKSFINFTESLLLQKLPLLLPKESTVIEILENVQPTPELVAACSEMAAQGYEEVIRKHTYMNRIEKMFSIIEADK